MRIVRGRSGQASTQAHTTFTGDVWADGVLLDDPHVKVNNVIFTPGARTYWHSHEEGQLLQVFRGSGIVCSRGGAPERIGEGDTVWIPAGEEHWHGAAIDSLLGHTATSLGGTLWLEEVEEGEYADANARPETPGVDDAGREH